MLTLPGEKHSCGLNLDRGFAFNIFISIAWDERGKIKDVNEKPGLDSDIGNGLNETT